MTQENWPAFPPMLLAQLREYCQQTGTAMQMHLNDHVCTVVLPDGQRLLVNYDIARNRLWLAGGGFASEYRIIDSVWSEIGTQSALSVDFSKALAVLIASNPINAKAGAVEQLSAVRKLASINPEIADKKYGPSPFWLLVLLPLAFLAYQYGQKPQALPAQSGLALPTPITQPEPNVSNQLGVDASCENSPPEHGRTARFVGGAQTLTAPVNVVFDNAHNYDLLVYFTEPGSVKPMHSIFVKAKQKAALQVATGRYELLFVHGQQWCNNKRGFLDASMVKLSHVFEVSAELPLLLNLQSKGDGPLEFQVFSKDPSAPEALEPPAMQIESSGALELRIQPDGHYYVDSRVDSVPVRFVVDTGATVTMLGKSAVGKIQVQNCTMGKVNTANGVIEACFGTVRELRIGPHVIYNAPVSINPNSEANLLGMSVLGRFKLSSEQGVMRISQ